MTKTTCLLILLASFLFSDADAQVKRSSSKSAKIKKSPKVQYGTASFYHNRFNGRKTASGEIFNQKKLTAAHNAVPFGTLLRVTNMRNKKIVIVKVTDRLRYRSRRLIDLSKAAARKIGFSASGLLRVKVEIISGSYPTAKASR